MLYNYSIWYTHPVFNRRLLVRKAKEDIAGSVSLMQSIGWIVLEIIPVHTYTTIPFELRSFKTNPLFDEPNN